MNRIELYQNDCLEVFPHIAANSVDLILADPPYGTTENEWDNIIPLDAMWAQLRRIVKPRGAIVLTASQPFTSMLVNSARDLFKYEWIWEKNIPTGHVHAKNKPMKKHENVLVFSRGTTVHENQSENRMHYYPQGVREHEVVVRGSNKNKISDTVMGARSGHKENYSIAGGGYPDSMLRFNRPTHAEHSTQKPVDLFAYLIRTYSQKDELVLDFCMGSGTTGVAACYMRRNFIGVEKDPEYFALAERRCRGAGSGFSAGGQQIITGHAPVRQAPRVIRPVSKRVFRKVD